MKMKLKKSIVDAALSKTNPTRLARRLDVSRQTIYNMIDGIWQPDTLRILSEIAVLAAGTTDIKLTDLLEPIEAGNGN